MLSMFVFVLGLSGYSLHLPEPAAPTESVASVEPVVSTKPTHPIAVEDGAEIYMTRCMSCHQMNGSGVPGVFPPLTETEWVTGDKGRLIRIVLNGLTDQIEVNDETYSGAMPPWGSFLDDEQMSELLTYMRTSWGNDAEEVIPEEVQKVREAVADRSEPWTAEELGDPANQGIPGEEG
jgi:mono/diheme cytochrome c family protein